MIISLIVAVSENNVIGKDNALPWHLPADVKYFRDVTMGHCVITGRKNYESIPLKFRPLAGRTNIVITRQKEYKAEKCIVVHSIEEAISESKKNNETEVFIIGGADIFEQTISRADRIYFTKIHHLIDGDTFFPEIDECEWKLVKRMDVQADEKNKYPFSFLVYERK